LRKWYWTVRGLMNSWAPISGFVRLSRASTTFWVMESIRLDLGYGSQVHP
jgi:ABC-type protease/lipase transport system fused ATPase/permease subunit